MLLVNAPKRHEYKYLLTIKDYHELRARLKKVMRLDSFSGENNGYLVRSLYFDDPYDTSYHEKVAGVSMRKKYRIRIYNCDQRTIKLEEKIKYIDMVHKNSCIISQQDVMSILEGDYSNLLNSSDPFKQYLYVKFISRILKPKVIVDYFREAYILPYNRIRVTIDRSLAAGKPSEDFFNKDAITYRTDLMYAFILEVKYDNFLPDYLKSILNLYGGTRLAVSKYCLCREVIESMQERGLVNE